MVPSALLQWGQSGFGACPILYILIIIIIIFISLTTVDFSVRLYHSGPYSVHVSGFGGVVPIMEPWQMDLVFAWEVWFGLCVDVGGEVPNIV